MYAKDDATCANTPTSGMCNKLGSCKIDGKATPATCDAVADFAKDTLKIENFKIGTCVPITLEDTTEMNVKVTCTAADAGGSSGAAAFTVAAAFTGLLAML